MALSLEEEIEQVPKPPLCLCVHVPAVREAPAVLTVILFSQTGYTKNVCLRTR